MHGKFVHILKIKHVRSKGWKGALDRRGYSNPR